MRPMHQGVAICSADVTATIRLTNVSFTAGFIDVASQ
jgi:hypothetical protein